LFLKHNKAEESTPEVTFFMVGRINMIPTWEDDALFLNTADYVCSEDAKWVDSLFDGYFHVPLKPLKPVVDGVPENWLEVGADDVVILGLFSSFRRQKKMS
jgi:hypothetical protein